MSASDLATPASNLRHLEGKMGTLLGILLIVLAGLPIPGSAQSSPGPGARIRIAQTDGTVQTGTLEDATPRRISLLSDQEGQEYVIPMARVGKVEASMGLERRFGKYCAIGVASTSVLAGTISAAGWSPCTRTGPFACLLSPESRGEAFMWGLVAGALIGVPIGLVVGLSVQEERWERVTLPGSPGVTVSIRPVIAPRPGFSASMSIGGR
jgi:hypothetical protein